MRDLINTRPLTVTWWNYSQWSAHHLPGELNLNLGRLQICVWCWR